MHILVTGASRGIGYELVKRFASDEGNTIMAISRNATRLNKLMDECSGENYRGRVTILPCDLQQTDDIKSLKTELEREFGHLDILINNAGYLFNHRFEDFPATEMYKVFDVNFFAMVRLTQEVLPMLEKSKFPHIVNISSMGGFQGSSKYPGLSIYSASKGAASILTECMAIELEAKGIHVNCLALGAVQTEMLNEAFPGYKPPMDAVQMAIFIKDFAVNGANYFNGKILPVNLSNP